ncbi:TatD family hydrolase [Membranicola marinus]|uniref:TatD family hydrolase n=1 Tax=Membranihabitans marinus TaxID=1227546 RepID=A0A953L727_9BACT|nr:TatD family hydrolase [Membranihabitans marinus]MBY5958287.1 TatD family hydrolase [Membranihabitans marinus]
MIIDTHAHLYLDKFDTDIDLVVNRARDAGVEEVYLPNIDHSTIDDLFSLCDRYPDFFKPMLGLHPVYVKDNYLSELEAIERRLDERPLVAIGEIGSDLYWDKNYLEYQKDAFDIQCEWALERNLPIVIHARDSLDMQINMVQEQKPALKGVFHCFTGTEEQARKIIAMNFFLGIGGILTYKNSTLDEVIEVIGLENVVLETDSPYLSPSPHRGKRNESAYLSHVVRKLSETLSVNIEEVEQITSRNAREIFN